jgi:hypothetical protein
MGRGRSGFRGWDAYVREEGDSVDCVGVMAPCLRPCHAWLRRR